MARQMEVHAQCPWCGPLVAAGTAFRCEIEPKTAQAICELACPGCSRTVLLPTTASVGEVLFEAGAGHFSGAVPFELLEPHSGPPLTWDDLLDFTLALDAAPFPPIGEERT